MNLKKLTYLFRLFSYLQIFQTFEVFDTIDFSDFIVVQPPENSEYVKKESPDLLGQ